MLGSRRTMQHVFIIGSKGIPGSYGGYETFVDRLTEYHQDKYGIKYHVACKGAKNGEFEYHNAHCFQLKVPNIGAAQAIYYDLKSLEYCCKYAKKHHINNFVIYVLACRIGPFISYFRKKIVKMGGMIYTNPDGHEFLRKKWTPIVRKYWKLSERLMVKHSDLLVCDSKNIKLYIQSEYAKYKPNTIFIAYGAELPRSTLKNNDPFLVNWYQKNGLSVKSYYLIVGRFVPENNFETIIREFMKSNSRKKLVIITTTNNTLQKKLEKKLHLKADKRIKFVGTVYDKELLKKIRENAYGYFHGHEVGGTNPSLLESLCSTDLNMLLDVGFNKEVAEESALYWNKEDGNLSDLINYAETIPQNEIKKLGAKAKEQIKNRYSWDFIASEYECLFLGTK